MKFASPFCGELSVRLTTFIEARLLTKQKRLVAVKARILRNLIGRQVRRYRWAKDWSQEELADHLHDIGLNIGRQRIAKIEIGEAWVSDIEIILIAKAFDVKIEQMFPQLDSSQSIFIVLSKMTGGKLNMLMSPDEILANRSMKLLNGNGHEILSRIQAKIKGGKSKVRNDRF